MAGPDAYERFHGIDALALIAGAASRAKSRAPWPPLEASAATKAKGWRHQIARVEALRRAGQPFWKIAREAGLSLGLVHRTSG